jgi:hypothetical protein
MIRGNRLVIPIREREWKYCTGQMSDLSYQGNIGQRMELSLEECEAVITYLPLITTFVIEERSKVVTK